MGKLESLYFLSFFLSFLTQKYLLRDKVAKKNFFRIKLERIKCEKFTSKVWLTFFCVVLPVVKFTLSTEFRYTNLKVMATIFSIFISMSDHFMK